MINLPDVVAQIAPTGIGGFLQPLGGIRFMGPKANFTSVFEGVSMFPGPSPSSIYSRYNIRFDDPNYYSN